MSILTKNTSIFTPPPLSPSLNNLYNSLSNDNKTIFLRVFRFIWERLIDVRRFTGTGGVLHTYWAIDQIRQNNDLTSSSLALLTYLYHTTGCNKHFVNSMDLCNSFVLPGVLVESKHKLLSNLTVSGYIERSFNDPGNPHYKKSFASHPCFVRLSPPGMRLIQSIEKDLYKILVDQSFADLTGTQKKPRRSKSRL